MHQIALREAISAYACGRRELHAKVVGFVNVADGSDSARVELARRLRALRGDITQQQIASALGVTVSAVSNWESVHNPRIPQPGHLSAYARLFGTGRSADGDQPRLRGDDELTDDERRRFEELDRELSDLWSAARPASIETTSRRVLTSPLGEFWHYEDGADVTLVCSELPIEARKENAYADPTNPDYVRLFAYTELDALVELYGHVRAVNPTTQVNFRLGHELTEDDYTTHLVLLGGVDLNVATESVMPLLDLPVHQVSAPRKQDSYFEVDDGTGAVQYRPRIREHATGIELREDVAHLYRGYNPLNAARTLTICSGIFARGTYAAVRALTDARFRNRNEHFLKKYPRPQPWSILARVPVLADVTVTPDFTQAITRLYEWPPR